MFLLGDTNGLSMRLKEKTPGNNRTCRAELRKATKAGKHHCTHTQKKRYLALPLWIKICKFVQIPGQALCLQRNFSCRKIPPSLWRLFTSFYGSGPIEKKKRWIWLHQNVESVIMAAILLLPETALLAFPEAKSDLTSIVRRRCFQLLLPLNHTVTLSETP